MPVTGYRDIPCDFLTLDKDYVMWSPMHWPKGSEADLDDLSVSGIELLFLPSNLPEVAVLQHIGGKFTTESASYRLEALVCFLIASCFCVALICAYVFRSPELTE